MPELLDAADDDEPVHCRLGTVGEKASERADDEPIVEDRFRVMLMSSAGRVDQFEPGVLAASPRLGLLESQKPWVPCDDALTVDWECGGL